MCFTYKRNEIGSQEDPKVVISSGNVAPSRVNLKTLFEVRTDAQTDAQTDAIQIPGSVPYRTHTLGRGGVPFPSLFPFSEWQGSLPVRGARPPRSSL